MSGARKTLLGGLGHWAAVVVGFGLVAVVASAWAFGFATPYMTGGMLQTRFPHCAGFEFLIGDDHRAVDGQAPDSA